MPPFLSVFTLCTEVVVTAVVLYVFYSGYAKNRFPYALAAFAMLYEVAFNITYMAYRAAAHAGAEAAGVPEAETPLQVALAIFHGTLSLAMFLALIAFFVLAWRGYGRGENYFRERKALTFTFIGLWLLAVVSGVAFFFALY